METELQEVRPVEEEFGGEDDGTGGPVKSFLEHLEDLRWMIIKCLASVMVAMVLCFALGNHVVSILKWPLERSEFNRLTSEQMVVLFVGNHEVTRFAVKTNHIGSLLLGAERVTPLRLVPEQQGTNTLLALERMGPGQAKDLPTTAVTLRNFSPLEGFMVALHLAFYGGLGLASPFVLYFIGVFVIPALKRKERAFIYRSLGVAMVLFVCGVAFCYFVMLPLALRAAVLYSNWQGFSATDWRADDYVGFVLKFMLAMGIGFELPVVVMTLVKVGILDFARLKHFRAYFLIVNMVISMVFSPSGDAFSMVLMAMPLQVLYEACVWLSWWGERKARKAAGAG